MYFFPRSLLLFKIPRTLENQVSKHLLDTRPLNIAFNLVPSQAQWPHSVGIVPEILKMTCDGKWFRVFQIYSGEFLIWNDFSKQKIKNQTMCGLSEWQDNPVILSTGVEIGAPVLRTILHILVLYFYYSHTCPMNWILFVPVPPAKPSQGREGYQHWGEIAKNECWPMQYTAINST